MRQTLEQIFDGKSTRPLFLPDVLSFFLFTSFFPFLSSFFFSFFLSYLFSKVDIVPSCFLDHLVVDLKPISDLDPCLFPNTGISIP